MPFFLPFFISLMLGHPGQLMPDRDLPLFSQHYLLETKFFYQNQKSKNNVKRVVEVSSTQPIVVKDNPSLNPQNTYHPPTPKSEGIENDDPNLNSRNTINPSNDLHSYVPPTIEGKDSPSLNPQNIWSPPSNKNKDKPPENSGNPVNFRESGPVSQSGVPLVIQPVGGNNPADPSDGTERVNPPILHSPPTISPGPVSGAI